MGQHYEGSWSWAAGSRNGRSVWILRFGSLAAFPEASYLSSGPDGAYNLIQTEDWPNFGSNVYTADSLNSTAGTVGVGFPQLLAWILSDAATIGVDRAGTLPYLDQAWTGWSVQARRLGDAVPFFGTTKNPPPSYIEYVAFRTDTGEAGGTAPPGFPPIPQVDPTAPGGAGKPSGGAHPPPPQKRPDPPRHPPHVVIPGDTLGPISVKIPEDTPAIDPLIDIPVGDWIETPSGGGSGGGGQGTNPADQPLVTWQIVLQQGVDRPNAIFGWEVAPRNVKTMKRMDDGATTANRITGYGGTPPAETLTFRGEWDSGATYYERQYVTKDGAIYRANETTTNVNPATEAYFGVHRRWTYPGNTDFPGADTGAWEAPWSGGDYQAGFYVTHDDNIYVAKLTHTSTADKEPNVGVNWRTYWYPINSPGGVQQLKYTTQDDESVALIGVYADTENYSFATTMATLKAMVDASLRRRRFGTQLITFDPQPGHPALPKPWADFDKGDRVRVRAGRRLRGGLPAKILNAFGRQLEVQRINGWDIVLDNEGNEMLDKVYTEEDLG